MAHKLKTEKQLQHLHHITTNAAIRPSPMQLIPDIQNKVQPVVRSSHKPTDYPICLQEQTILPNFAAGIQSHTHAEVTIISK